MIDESEIIESVSITKELSLPHCDGKINIVDDQIYIPASLYVEPVLCDDSEPQDSGIFTCSVGPDVKSESFFRDRLKRRRLIDDIYTLHNYRSSPVVKREKMTHQTIVNLRQIFSSIITMLCLAAGQRGDNPLQESLVHIYPDKGQFRYRGGKLSIISIGNEKPDETPVLDAAIDYYIDLRKFLSFLINKGCEMEAKRDGDIDKTNDALERYLEHLAKESCHCSELDSYKD